MRKGILCNNCYKPLTKKEANRYSIMWQFSGDMYCDKCEKMLKEQEKKADRIIKETFIKMRKSIGYTDEQIIGFVMMRFNLFYEDAKKEVDEVLKDFAII